MQKTFVMRILNRMYKHQSATGTGVEASFNSAVGSADVNTLSDSTEADDLKRRSD